VLGCPQAIASRKKIGAFLMHDAPCVERIVRLLAKHLTVIVSVKIRIFPKLEETLSFCKMLENAGCQLLTVRI
jgi:tRNA-dihydrouridine synthase 1